jgi:chemotaxis protein histidine kinase CheA
MKQTYTLTLTRWHKVAERLARDYGESVSECRSTLTQTVVSAYLGEEQEKFLQNQTHSALANLERAFGIQDAVAHIRHLVGEANVREGVSAKLAEFDKLNRRVKTLSEVVESQSTDMVSVAQLRSIPKDYVADGASYDSKRPKIKVRMLDMDAMERLADQLSTARKAVYALSDEVSDLNKAKLSIDLETDVASAAGL